MQRDYDVVIVGGGPAGISTALHLHDVAPRRRVLVLEKERYPREKICAGGIGARAFKLLEKIGVVVDCPCVRFDAVAMRVAGETLVAREAWAGVVVRRIEFDHAFARIAVDRGIEVRDGHEVTAIRVGDHGVTIEVDGEQLTARALVGADGVGGIVRRQLGFPRGELRAQAVELDTGPAAVDQPRDTVVFDFSITALRGYAWDFPTQVAGEPLMCRGVYVLRDPRSRELAAPSAEPRTRLAGYLADRGLDITHHRAKQFAERGFEPGAEIAAPRVLLVGEAAGIDIATGEGIGQAIEYGSLAGRYLADALAHDDLGFTDWRRTVAKHHLGWQLVLRHALYRTFYSHRRPRIEPLMPSMHQLFRVGVQDFAGLPMSKLAVVRGTGQLLAAYTRAKLASRRSSAPA
ncbi:MAG: FAD-dependent monooxygenase [Myxococcota bacterium]|nr:FAD-dependent monooxygenase [Myxococcota bacterium]